MIAAAIFLIGFGLLWLNFCWYFNWSVAPGRLSLWVGLLLALIEATVLAWKYAP
jgi:hypothetical protein